MVFAGLIPQLQGEGNWLIESFRPEDKPFYQLACALVRQLEPEAGETKQLREAVGLTGDMQQGRITLQQVVYRIVECNPGKRLLLIADQFEELYTLCHVKEEQEGFIDTLLAAIYQENLTLVLTLRADFYSFVLSYRPFRDALQQFTPQLLSSMSREELQAAIEQPAHKLEVQIEAQLTQRMLDDVGQEPGNLPLLEFALTRLWEKQQNRELTHQAYDEIGGVKKAIASHAEQIYQQLSEAQQKQAQQVFVQLVRPGEGTEDTRRIATRAEVGEKWGLVSYLAGYPARLVVTGRHEKEDTVEVVHEALIREWGTLREWINANRQFRTWQERLKVALREWKNSNHDFGALLRGVPLAVAQDWLHKRASEMTQEEQEFIRASAKQRDKEQEERESARRLTRNILIGGLIGALSLAGIAGVGWYNASINQINAYLASSKAYLATSQKLDALVEGIKAGKQLQNTFGVDADTRLQVVNVLQQTVYNVREFNRLSWQIDSVETASFSPDGRIVAAASNDGTIKIWSLSGELLHTLKGHKGFVNSISFSPNGQRIASASSDKTVKLWSLDGKLLHTFEGNPGDVSTARFSPDGQIIASKSYDSTIVGHTIKLWNLKGELLHTIKHYSIEDFSFSPNGKIIASCASDGIKLWNTSGKLLQTLKEGGGRVSFSPDGKTIASLGKDNTIKLWSLEGKLLHTLEEGGDLLGFSQNGRTIASVDNNNTIKIWSRSGELLYVLDGHRNQVWSVSFSPDGQTIASVSKDKTVRIWNLSSELPETIKGHKGAVKMVTFSPDGKTIASASDDQTVKLWSLPGNLLRTIKGHTAPVNSVSFSPDGKTIASASDDKTVKLWNLSGNLLHSLEGHTQQVKSITFSSDGQIIASADLHEIRLWNSLGKLQKTIEENNGNGVNSISFSPDGKTIAVAVWDIKLWDLSGKLLHNLEGHQDIVHNVSFSPDGQLIASASLDDTIRLWDLSGKLLKTFDGHGSSVSSVSFSPDGKTIASSGNTSVKVWNLSGELLNTFEGHTDYVWSVSFNPDGQTIASGSEDGTIQLWHFSSNLTNLLARGCHQLHDYLNNPSISENDQHLCDGL